MSASTEIGIGEQLRRARESQCREIGHIAEEICIRSRHLEALESEDFSALPAPAYTVCFLRAYAETLGLNAEELVGIYKTGIESEELKPELVFPEPVYQTRIPGRAVLTMAIVALVGLYFGWIYEPRNGDIISSAIPPIPETLMALVGDSEASSKEALQAPASEASSRPDIERDASGAGAQVEQEIDKNNGLVEVAEGQPKAEPPAEVAIAHPDQAKTAGPASPQHSEAGFVPSTLLGRNAIADAIADRTQRIVLRAVQDTWIHISDGETVVFDGVLRQDQEYAPPLMDGLEMMTGNAGGLEVIVDGEKVKPLGAEGVIVRRVRLDPERLKRGTAVASRD